jgi:hypothetical protein
MAPPKKLQRGHERHEEVLQGPYCLGKMMGQSLPLAHLIPAQKESFGIWLAEWYGTPNWQSRCPGGDHFEEMDSHIVPLMVSDPMSVGYF